MYIFPDFIYSLAKLLFDRLSKQKEFSHVSLSYLFLSSMFIVSARAAKHARSFLVRLHSKWHNCKKKNLIYKGCVARILRFHHTLHKSRYHRWEKLMPLVPLWLCQEHQNEENNEQNDQERNQHNLPLDASLLHHHGHSFLHQHHPVRQRHVKEVMRDQPVKCLGTCCVQNWNTNKSTHSRQPNNTPAQNQVGWKQSPSPSLGRLRSFPVKQSCTQVIISPFTVPAQLYQLCTLPIAITCPDSSSCMVSPTPPILWTLALSSSSSSSCCLK